MSDFLSQIDPFTDPSGASAALEDVMATPAPVLTTAQTIVKLPGGVRYPGDPTIYKDAEVRELTGEDEEALSRLQVSNQGSADLWLRKRRLIMERGLVSVGPGKPDPRQLFLGDREEILLGIRIATWGADYDARIDCTGCKESKDIIFELDKDVEYKEVDDPYDLNEVRLRSGKRAVLRRPTADDQDYALGDGKGAPAEMNTRLLSRLLVSVDDVEINLVYPGGSFEYVRSLGMKDRDALGRAVADMDFGPKLGEVVVTCEDCGTDWKGSLSTSALF